MQNDHYIPLAVFPFEDLSHQKELGIFCRSFSEDLMTELSRFRQLSVIKFPNHILFNDPDKLFEKLRNGYYVQGTFRSDKQILRINVQLYAGDSQNLVWGNRLEGKLTELNDIQDNLLKSVVAVLQQQIDLDLLSRIRQRQKVAFTAYEHWLYGMEELKKATVESDLIAREHFEKALEIQPDYALACTGMSLSYFNEWTCQLWERWDVSKSGAYEWAQRAIELDDQNHIIALVLGRIFLYDGSYNTSEYYLKRSVMLNSNDPDTLFPIALYLVYLDLGQEALELYEKGMQANPFFIGNHLRLIGVIHFELGNYEKAASFIEHHQMGKAQIADTDAYCAAIYYHLQQYDKMQVYWNSYLATYRRLISKDKDFPEQEAIDWIYKLNPHKHGSNLDEFLKFISKGSYIKDPAHSSKQNLVNNLACCFIRDNGTWKFSYDGVVVQAPEVKGFYDIQKMLEQPGQVFHCAELMGSTLESSGEKIIDEKARKNYHKKILEIQNELEEAEKFSDFAQLEKLQEEYDQMIEHLSKSLNLKGKVKETGGTIEKARSAVTWRIRNAIAKIEQSHPALGAHFSNSVKTGTLCSYKPDRNIEWVTS